MLSSQWLATIALFAVIKWGHIWRQRTNHSQGIMTVDDDRQVPGEGTSGAQDQDLEKAVSRTGDPETDGLDHDHEEARDAHEPIAAREAKNRRTRKEGDMPPVKEVLRRTTSLSQASVQGG